MIEAPGDTTRLFDASTEAVIYAASGHLLFMREGVLFAQRVDDASLALVGTTVTVAGNVVARRAPTARPPRQRARAS